VAEIIGKSEIGASDSGYAGNWKGACKFTAPYKGKISKIKCYTRSHKDGSTCPVKVGIYSDKDGEPYLLITSSEEKIVDDQAKWVEFALNTTVSIEKGKAYWLAFICDVNTAEEIWGCRFYYDDGEENQFARSEDTYVDDFMTFFEPSAWNDFEVSIYTEYDSVEYDTPLQTMLGDAKNVLEKEISDVTVYTEWPVKGPKLPAISIIPIGGGQEQVGLGEKIQADTEAIHQIFNIQVDIWARTPSQVLSLADKVRLALWKNRERFGRYITGISLLDERWSLSAKLGEKRISRSTLTYRVIYPMSVVT